MTTTNRGASTGHRRVAADGGRDARDRKVADHPTRQRTLVGINAVSTTLRRAPDTIVRICRQRDLGARRAARLGIALEGRTIGVEHVGIDDLTRLAGTDRHQGVIAIVRERSPLNEAEAKDFVRGLSVPLLLILDGVQDPRNFGACLRTADAAGVDLVVTARSRNVGLTPVVSKVAAGAAGLQPVAEVANLARFMKFLAAEGVWLIGTDDAAEKSLYDVDLQPGLALILGAEGAGLRRLTRERCDELVSLPMRGAVESLNVSVATGVCLYECLRQRSS
ncbi:MAG: 23S rRNA (guanosine(2251)-2'-O)-methyltransferase RlmB [Gammaproteobacteria bacterium]|nr:23S rRNA (guanosine(2251)-2'-O)-methyltransferase RlmB [Gammaproteobacteria bacterium]